MNEQIRCEKIRLIDDEGKMLGIVDLKQGLIAAKNASLDLVEISPDASPPVCKVMDFGKFRYEEQKRMKEMRKKQKKVDTKEIKLSPRIATGDYKIKLNRAEEFIKAGHKVRVSLYFRGREITHNEIGFDVMKRFQKDMEVFATTELQPKMEGRQIFMIFIPNPKK